MSNPDWHGLFHELNHAICVVRMPGPAAHSLGEVRIVEANPAFCALTGVASPTGRSLSSVLPELEGAWAAMVASLADANKGRLTLPPTALRPTGLEAHASMFGSPDARLVALSIHPSTSQPAAASGDPSAAGAPRPTMRVSASSPTRRPPCCG